MTNIISVKGLVESYMSRLEGDNSQLKDCSFVPCEDNMTNLSVNGNGSQTYDTAKNVTERLTDHIEEDRNRIITMADLFEQKDAELASGW